MLKTAQRFYMSSKISSGINSFISSGTITSPNSFVVYIYTGSFYSAATGSAAGALLKSD